MSMNKKYTWTIIGAGPAGIAAVGKLLDQGIVETDILWIDPEFAVGDLGTKWNYVSSNTKTKFFNAFLDDCANFENSARPKTLPFDELDPEETCQLELIAEPLRWVTSRIRSRVDTVQAKVDTLSLQQRVWNIVTPEGTYISKNVILAIGAEPKHLSYDSVEEISLEDALVPQKLAERCDVSDTVAVFGSSHSAVIVLQQLVDMGVKKVINFYQSPMKYAVPMGDWILHDNTGLKGNAALWAKENINGELPENLVRVRSTPENLDTYLPECDKAIYAIGFNKRQIDVEGMDEVEHNVHNSIIAPGLFGIGICFPEEVTDKYGNRETNVGLWKFMKYINKIMPIWMNYSP